jgi:DNA-binding CsgD family transcriptional regulator
MYRAGKKPLRKIISQKGDHAQAELLNLVWRCAADARVWTDFLARLSKATQATHAVIVFQTSKSSLDSATAAFVGINPELRHVFERVYCRYCKERPCKVSMPRPGSKAATNGLILDEHTICLPPPKATSKRLLRVRVVQFLKANDCEATLSVFRSMDLKPFGRAELNLLYGLIPYLQFAAEINGNALFLQTEKEAAWEALDRMPIGVILVDKKGKPLMMSQRARSILEENDGISISDGYVCAARQEETKTILRLITATPPGDSNQSILALSRPSGRRSLSVVVTPYNSRKYFFQFDKPAAMLFISDPEHMLETKANALRRFYDLTPAEARLASLLTQGRSLKLAAQDLHITYSSARNHLKHIFAKTGAGRQSELIRLLLSSPATIG